MAFFDDALRSLGVRFDAFSTNALRILNQRLASVTARSEARFDSLDRAIHQLNQLTRENMATLADIRAKVESQQTVIGSAVTLLDQLSQMLKDAIASNDPQAMQAIADMLDSESQSLADAVTANTPAAPPSP